MAPPSLIFDCDGVLVNSEEIYIATERAMLQEIGLDYEMADYQTRFIGLSDTDFVEALVADYAAAGLGVFPAEFLSRRTEECWRRFETELRPTPGLVAFLEGGAGDVARAVASSSTPDFLARKLAMTGLDGYFAPHIYSGRQVPNGKPAPDLFLLAASKIDAAPGDCIVIEDSANGVKAGRAAEMQVWGFVGGGHGDAGLAGRLSAAGAHRVFESFDALAETYAALR